LSRASDRQFVVRLLGGALENDGKFLATGSGDEHVFMHVSAQDLGQILDDLIADRVTETVVDFLEAVDVG
jgi:hypothetical protein